MLVTREGGGEDEGGLDHLLLLTGASSRIQMLQYLHQYCFFDTQYLTVSKKVKGGVRVTLTYSDMVG
jgi:hypothetical protein